MVWINKATTYNDTPRCRLSWVVHQLWQMRRGVCPQLKKSAHCMAWEGRLDKHRYNMIQPIHNRDQQGYCKGLATIVSIPIYSYRSATYFRILCFITTGYYMFFRYWIRNSQGINDDGGRCQGLPSPCWSDCTLWGAWEGEGSMVGHGILGGLGWFWMDMLWFFEC